MSETLIHFDPQTLKSMDIVILTQLC